MARYATTVTFTVYTTGQPEPEDRSRVWAWADRSHSDLHDTMPDIQEVVFDEPETHEVKDD